jgi:hypothetical protein
MFALNLATASAIRACSSCRLAGRSATKTLSLTQPHTENSRGVKSGELSGQAAVPPRPNGTRPHDDLQGFYAALH